MNDLARRLHELEKILASPVVGKKKLMQCGQCLSGLDLKLLTPKMRRILEKMMSSSNQILQRYDIATWDDYGKISVSDMVKLINNMQSMCVQLQTLMANINQ